MARRFGKRVDQLNGVISGAFRRKARWELGRENIGKFFQKGADDLGEKVKRARGCGRCGLQFRSRVSGDHIIGLEMEQFTCS